MIRRFFLLSLVATVLAVGAAGPASFAAPPMVWQTLPTPAPLPAARSSSYVAHNGANIYYATYGAGRPVILLHGGLANGRYWGNQVPALTGAGYQAILIDSRGHGRSSRDERPYTYELMASDVVAVMDHLNIPKAAVVGWSDGAIIGLVMALKDPNRLTRVFAFAANMDPSGVKPDTTTNPTFARFMREAATQYAQLSPTPNGFPAFSKAINHMWDVEPNYKAADLATIRTRWRSPTGTTTKRSSERTPIISPTPSPARNSSSCRAPATSPCCSDPANSTRPCWSSSRRTDLRRFASVRRANMEGRMKIDGVPYRTIWLAEDGHTVEVIDQTRLPHAFEIRRLATLADAAHAILTMVVRGAPLIGATAAYGMALAAREDPTDEGLERAAQALLATRPTAVNLHWAVQAIRTSLQGVRPGDRAELAYAEAAKLCDAEVTACESIAEHGEALIRSAYNGSAPVNVLTHCNAGWLAAVDWGMSLAPVYRAHDAGITVHVWVDETRPRNQGAALTAWELHRHGVPHTVIVDNAGGHLMQHGMVDLCIVGSDRVAANGDVCNKIGTYLKALAAHDNGVPFYAALPSSTIDWSLADGGRIPIEQRSAGEVTHMQGLSASGEIVEVQLTPEGSPAGNYAFDITPARLVTAIITERGVCSADRAGLASLFPDLAKAA